MTDPRGEDARVRRIGLNESLFRSVNEQLEELAVQVPEGDGKLDLVCECGRADCTQRIRVERAEYEALRSDPRLFAVVPGHQQPEAEEIVVHETGFDIVRKKPGIAADVARETDPRA